MANKVYAVRKGLKTGIFRSWDECQASVKGFPGAEFKSFSNDVDAYNYLNEALIQEKVKPYKFKMELDSLFNSENESDPSVLEAYVDGSYNGDIYGSGVVVVGGGEYSFYGDNELYLQEHQIAGEVSAAIFAITLAVLQSKDKVIIYYDYQGIEKWAVGDWRAKSNVAKRYVELISELKKYIDIEFIKVLAHSNIENNEKADLLARKAKFKYEVL